MSRTTITGLILGSAHLIAYTLTLSLAGSGWARAAIFMLWQIADLPVSVIIYLSAFSHTWDLTHRIFSGTHVWASLLPLIVADGVLGSLWWFMLPRLSVWIEQAWSSR